MDLNFHPLISQEVRRLGFYGRDLILIQLLTLVHVGVFSFLLSDILIVHPKIGSCFFWLVQASAIFLLSDRLFNKDLAQGFFINVLNSSCSLPMFIGLRWLLFTITFAGSTIVVMPISLMLLGLPFNLWRCFILLVLPYVAIVIGYGSLLSLLTYGMRSYLMPILLFPLIVPVLILATSGTLDDNINLCLVSLIALLLCIIPGIIYLMASILRTLCDD